MTAVFFSWRGTLSSKNRKIVSWIVTKLYAWSCSSKAKQNCNFNTQFTYNATNQTKQFSHCSFESPIPKIPKKAHIWRFLEIFREIVLEDGGTNGPYSYWGVPWKFFFNPNYAILWVSGKCIQTALSQQSIGVNKLCLQICVSHNE